MVNELTSKVGFSAIKITPAQDKIPLGGYYVRFSTGVHDDIYVRTLYIATTEQEIFIIACDLLGLYRKFVQRMRRRIAKRTGVPECNILICSLHDHSAPDTIGLEGIKGFLKYNLAVNWFRVIETQIVKSAQRAKRDARSSEIGVATKAIEFSEKLVINRRHPLRPLNIPLSVIRINQENMLVGSIVHFACHGTTLNRDNRLVSAEFSGYLIRKLNNAYPNLFSMYLNGPCGDINPYLFPEEWEFTKIDLDVYFKGEYGRYNDLCSYKHTRRIGERLADHSIELLERVKTEQIKKIQVISKTIDIPVNFNFPARTFSDFMFTLLIKKGLFRLLSAYNRSNISYFSFIEKEGNLFVQTEIQLILINNNILIVGIPAEVFSQIGEELVRKSPIQNTLIISLANDWIGYIFPLNEIQDGGYEVTGLANLAGILPGTVIKNQIISMYKRLKPE